MIQKLKKYTLVVPFALTLSLLGCNSEGIDRNADAVSTTNGAPLADPGESANSLGSAINSPGPDKYVLLNKLNFEARQPSLVSVLFQASDQFGNAIANLQTSDFSLLENNLPISQTETSLSIVPHDQLPFVLRTVIMIDNSSSILPVDLDKIKAAVTSLLVDDLGTSQLLAQQEIALYTFDDSITQIKDFSSNASTIVDAVNEIQPAQSLTPTDFYGAVIEGTSRWDDSFELSMITHGSLIIVTDGTDTAAKHTFQEALTAVAGKSVYTLGVGDEIAEDVLASIGTSDTFALRNFDQLSSTLQSINQQVRDRANSFYFLHYASPKRRAEGDVANSQHEIRLSVVNNANRSSSGEIVDSFNSAEFSNMLAEVVISGPQNLEIQQTAALRATTRWGPSPDTDYLWTFTDENVACTMEPLGSESILITGVAAGTCTISAQDQSAGGARNWHTVTVVSD